MSDDDKTRISPNIAYAGVGTQLSGIYELDERIASGGMGEVYRGHNIQTGDHVAIKIVLPEFARDQTILSLFRKEASILNHLSHDAVVRYHVFTIDTGIGRPYLAMEFVDGESLFDVMRRGPMPADDVRRLCHRLASGLSAVHQAGAVHRDLSPDNIILPGGRVERAKIIDFGIARSATGGETLIGGRFAGKYNYVSPEQLGLYGGDVSEQSDIYSLGLVLAAALRGEPLDMSGSQYEVIEKRRTVPDLSDIDPDFHELIEAMLQPDPRDRPASMAEIARATRGEDLEATLPPPAPFGARERSGLPRAGWTAPPGSKPQPPAPPPGEPRFVEHVRPAHLSEPRPAPAAAPAGAPKPAAPKKASRTPAIAGGVAALAALVGTGLYFSGVLAPPPAAEHAKPLTPKPVAEAAKPATEAQPPETPKPQPQAPASPQPEASKPDSSATIETAKPPAQPDEVKTPVAKPAPPATQPENEANNQTKPPQAETKPAQAPAEQSPTPLPTPAPKAAESEQPARPSSEPPAVKTPEPSQTTENKPKQDANPPTAKPSVKDIVDMLSKQPKPKASPAPAPESQPPSPPTSPTPTARQPQTPIAPAQPAQQPQPPPAKQPDNTDVAINVIKPALPSLEQETAKWTERRSWVRDFSGGSCFYANVTSGPGASPAIEGFGTAVQPFEQMLNDFQSRFHIEPDVSVRLITPSQCGVPTFLRFLDRSSAEKPQLVLDRTSVPDGTPVSGALYTGGGLISNVMLIDHKGVAFNLDDRMVPQTDKVTFNIPIGLGPTDKAAGKAVPQIMLVITGPKDLQAAMFSRPTPASELLPRILEEIEADGSQFSATATYFRLGG
ncbi:serine/threonine protein kinase [Mesorhizobium hawassense]|uniref:non-specific serine/threonine protein kinase n=1 Tax=Mesorhizobium hawassense TaxID=1209954 RepID=A0A330HV10_9HYPH|nr:protein kinase [Mesorhizobium hawassense]RAZ92481.1 serine/threonine protein kinase [Mesorhizobium hawassense]